MKLKLIEWADAFGVGPSWSPLDAIKGGVEQLVIVSVGYEVYRDATLVVLVPHVTKETKHCVPQGCGEMTIPISAILKEQTLCEET